MLLTANRLSEFFKALGKSFIYTSVVYSLFWYFHDISIGYSYPIAVWEAVVLFILLIFGGGVLWLIGYFLRRN